jgi:hydroxymethylbilane synthase
MDIKITVGARESPLSRVQVQEIWEEIKKNHPEITFEVIYVKTTGDLDQKTSLKTLDKTDFFTKEIDEMVLKGECRIGIHSGKDLPDPLPKGLKLIHLSQGVDPADVLILRKGEQLRPGMKIATSSLRREECVRALQENLTFVDIRGTVGARLEVLERGEVDGVVVAEAALIRLGLTHLHRVKLPGESAPLQGRLACVARENDSEMATLFKAEQNQNGPGASRPP